MLKIRYDLKKRIYIGNSTMDPELSFIQANLTHCTSNKLVLDPFCGTGKFYLYIGFSEKKYVKKKLKNYSKSIL